jgi:GntR family carbon starvation induced transcriptional regulator|tara:strand:- start:1782 stop:2444 length:663 start_codon:yes stop_codon:yes gene_type:complete
VNDSNQNTALETLNSLTSDIVQGKFLPREKLHIKTLSERYQVGMNPLREVLSQLIDKDLVICDNKKGFFVSDISIDDLTDIYQAIAKIEVLCVEMAIQKGDEYWEANVLATSHRLKKSGVSTRIGADKWQSRHLAFHGALVSGCMSPRLFQIRHSLYEKSTRYRNLWLKENVNKSSRNGVNQKEHVELTNLALDRDIDGATRLVEQHMLKPIELIKRSLS